MNDGFELRQADITDLDAVMQVFGDAIKVMEAEHIYQWDDVYPDRETLRGDILSGQMYVAQIGGETAAVVVLNQSCSKEYDEADWRYRDATFFVVHRLCVAPAFQNRGVGTETMLHAEALLRQKGIETVRLDAFSLNPYSNRMYLKLGYVKTGEAVWRKGLFYLYEKKL